MDGKKKQMCRRILSIALTVILTAALLPLEMLLGGGTVAKAATGSELVWDLSGVTAEKKTADFTVNGFTVKATSGKTVEVKTLAAGEVSSSEGKEFTTVLSLSGTGAATHRCITFTLPCSADVNVYARSGGDTARDLTVQNGSGEVGTLEAVAKTETTLSAKTITLTAGTYSIWSTNKGIDVYDIVVKPTLALDLSDVADKSFAAGDPAETIGDFTVTPGNDTMSISTADKEVTASDGESFTKRIGLGGTGSTTKRVITFALPVKTKMNFYAQSGGTDTRTLNIATSDGTIKATVSAESKEGAIAVGTVELEAGEYYVYSAGKGINVYNICAAPEVKEYTPWADVAVPQITKVDVNSDGNFVVDFTAQIGQYEGAQCVMVTMLEGGCEVRTEKVVSAKTTQVVFQPMRSGNYTFVAVAQRTGEADKVSNTVAYDNYVMKVQSPVITWAQDKGSGSVYLDWVNLEDADSYAVGYRQGGSGDYTYVETALPATQGDYTLTGLTAGQSYELIVEATRNSDHFKSTATKTLTLGSTETQPWYAALVGSGQQGDITVMDASGSQLKHHQFDVSDEQTNKTNFEASDDVSNNSGKLAIAAQTGGKISDDEDGFAYYFTKIDPDTENFKIGATFKITDISKNPDNQTGFGLVAADMLGINNWGDPDYVHKYFNYVSSMMYSSSKQSNPVMRTTSGYLSPDASVNDGADRVNANQKFTDVASDWSVGATYSFTLEKTDAGYTATCNGQELKLDDNSMTSVQEDGTVCVGVMCSRKVGVEVTDISFTKSASAGITSGGNSDGMITPNGTVYSSNTCGAQEYEYIFVPNCAGSLTVSGANGVAADNVALAANQVARVNVPLQVGKNTIHATFVPAAASNITSTAAVTKETTVTCARYGNEGETIIVSADGSADGKGTMESPLDIATAVKYAQPGQVLYLRNGVYKTGASIGRSVSGTAQKNITMVAESISTNGSNGVVFEGAGISLTGSYWHIYGIYVKDAPGVGIQISGNYNTVEMCTVNHSANSGIQLSRSGSAGNEAGRVGKLWPTGNLVKNCESFDNCDAGRNDADGFAAKLTCGEENRFYGCIAHNNIDDGWDLYAKSISGEIGAVTIENCVAYHNGWLTTDDITQAGYVFGEGNGFKLGGGYLKGGHVLRNSITFANHAKGITSNSCPDCEIYDATSYYNSLYQEKGEYNVGLNTKESNVKAWKVSGLISMNSADNTKTADLIPFSLSSTNNYIYNGSASYNTQGVQAADDWFESVDISVLPTRNPDGTINMHNLLTLKASAPSDSGARLDVTSDAAKSVAPKITTIVGSVAAVPDDGSSNDDSEDDAEPETPVVTDVVSVPVLIPGVEGDISNIVMAEVTALPESVMTDAVKLATGCNTAAELTQYLKAFVTVNAGEAPEGVLKDVPVQNTSVMDVIVKVSFDGGKTWSEATEANFPEAGLDIILPYPAGTTMDGFDFIVGHLYTKDWNGKIPGQTEYIVPEKTPMGIKAHITGASPFVVGWKAIVNTDDAVSAEPEKDMSPKTGDRVGRMIPVLVFLMLTAAAGAGWYVYNKKRGSLIR